MRETQFPLLKAVPKCCFLCGISLYFSNHTTPMDVSPINFFCPWLWLNFDMHRSLQFPGHFQCLAEFTIKSSYIQHEKSENRKKKILKISWILIDLLPSAAHHLQQSWTMFEKLFSPRNSLRVLVSHINLEHPHPSPHLAPSVDVWEDPKRRPKASVSTPFFRGGLTLKHFYGSNLPKYGSFGF